jgi:hypothetical protein
LPIVLRSILLNGGGRRLGVFPTIVAVGFDGGVDKGGNTLPLIHVPATKPSINHGEAHVLTFFGY